MILFDCEVGKTYVVKSINAGYKATKRLNDVGITPDIKIKVLNKVGPVLVEVRESKLAVGRGLSRMVEVEEI